MQELELPLLVEVARFPNRPARAIILRFYQTKIGVDVVNRKTGNELLSYCPRYEDGPKTDGLSREVINRVITNVQEQVKIYDDFRSQKLREDLFLINPVAIARQTIEDVAKYIMGRFDSSGMDSVIGAIR